ncbi:MAG: hypothetical protein H5T62_17175, partial [Anaerolineae bacterium]|nr:hypothetical protein [Anaerolineae bacterium]
MQVRIRLTITITVLLSLLWSLSALDIHADPPFDDLTPNQYTFVGRRGTTYTATWDTDTYEVRINTPDGTFPWDWMSFVGPDGVNSLSGLSGIG